MAKLTPHEKRVEFWYDFIDRIYPKKSLHSAWIESERFGIDFWLVTLRAMELYKEGKK